MKTFKYLGIGALITFVALICVHQRIEIFKEGYSLQESIRHLSSLIDRHSELVYNLSKLESSKNLLASLNGKEMEFSGHRTKYAPSSQFAYAEAWGKDSSENFITRLLDLFTIKAEAKPRES